MGALTDKYCIVGVGETPHLRPSNRTTLSMACEAVKKAMADAGLEPRDIDGMTSYQAGDSTSSNHVSTSLGIRSRAKSSNLISSATSSSPIARPARPTATW